jgi:hypothetical protein
MSINCTHYECRNKYECEVKPMTVRELISLLQAYPGGMRVVVSGYEGGFNDIAHGEIIELRLNVNVEWYYGPHERPDDDAKGDEMALLLRRSYGHKGA